MLGGRLDATNVLPSQGTVLTSVGLEHTQWLGDTEEEIGGEEAAPSSGLVYTRHAKTKSLADRGTPSCQVRFGRKW